MEHENSQVATTAAPDGVDWYPAVLAKLYLARARLEARTLVKQVRPQDTPDDRRLAAVLVAVAMSIILVFMSAVSGSSATSTILVVAFGFFATLFAALALVFGPEDEEVVVQRNELESRIPDAKKVWDENRAKDKVLFAARRARWMAAWRAQRARWSAKWAAWRGRRGAAAEPVEEELVELVPAPPIYYSRMGGRVRS